MALPFSIPFLTSSACVLIHFQKIYFTWHVCFWSLPEGHYGYRLERSPSKQHHRAGSKGLPRPSATAAKYTHTCCPLPSMLMGITPRASTFCTVSPYCSMRSSVSTAPDLTRYSMQATLSAENHRKWCGKWHNSLTYILHVTTSWREAFFILMPMLEVQLKYRVNQNGWLLSSVVTKFLAFHTTRPDNHSAPVLIFSVQSVKWYLLSFSQFLCCFCHYKCNCPSRVDTNKLYYIYSILKVNLV